MSDATDAHDPSARSAGTSTSVGRQRYLTAEQARELGRKSNLSARSWSCTPGR